MISLYLATNQDFYDPNEKLWSSEYNIKRERGVCERERECVCVCVCVWERERERIESKGSTDAQTPTHNRHNQKRPQVYDL